MKDSEIVLDYIYLMNYKCHKINQNRGKSYIDSPLDKKTVNAFNTFLQSC